MSAKQNAYSNTNNKQNVYKLQTSQKQITNKSSF